jgi:hypothetical protein
MIRAADPLQDWGAMLVTEFQQVSADPCVAASTRPPSSSPPLFSFFSFSFLFPFPSLASQLYPDGKLLLSEEFGAASGI